MRARQGALALLTLVVSLVTFRLVQLGVHARFNFETPLDRLVPFWPTTIFVYQGFFVYVLVAATLIPADAFARWHRRVVVAVLIGLALFALLPAAVSRPDAAGIDNPFLRQRFLKLRQLDDAHNSFPSLHVAITWLTSAALWKKHHGWIAVGLGLAITVSTLTVKQHVLADVLGGVALAALASRLVNGEPDAA